MTPERRQRGHRLTAEGHAVGVARLLCTHFSVTTCDEHRLLYREHVGDYLPAVVQPTYVIRCTDGCLYGADRELTVTNRLLLAGLVVGQCNSASST